MERFKIFFQPPLGISRGFSLRSAYTYVNGKEFVASGIADNDTIAKSKSMSELIERIAINKEVHSCQIICKCIFDKNICSVMPLANYVSNDCDEIFSSACRSNLTDSINDAIVEMYERTHLEIWCESLLNNIGTLKIYELTFSAFKTNRNLWKYINSFRLKIFISWVTSYNFMPSFIMIGSFDYSHKQIMVASSGRTIASAIHKGLLDIAKILVVEEHAHQFPRKPVLFHRDNSISRFCSTCTTKVYSYEQLMEEGGVYKEYKGHFNVNCIEFDLSDALNLRPVSITRTNMKKIIDLDNNFICNSGGSKIIRRYFS